MGLQRPPPGAERRATLAEIKQWFREAGGVPERVPTPERLITAANAMRKMLNLTPFELAR
jgi:hypothetical protein